MQASPVRDVVIIGGGASAALLAWNLARHHRRRCTIVAAADRPAFGLAYSTPSLKNLLNVAAGGMSADPEDAGHFVTWMQSNISEQTSEDTFVPRAVYGLYLRQLYCAAAPEHVQDLAIGCRREGGGFTIELAGGDTLKARQVVLALGNFDPARLPGVPSELDETGRYHHDAWADDVFAGIVPDDEVVLIGTGLTTVDVVLRLRENGHVGLITALSRRGMFPARHADHGKLAEPVLLPGDTPATARSYLAAFRRPLALGADWRSAVDSLRPVLNGLWSALPDVEKRRFRRHLQRRWDVRRHRMAPQIAEVLDLELQTGSLRVLNGSVRAVAVAGRRMRVTASSSDGAIEVDADHVINCTGPSLDYRKSGSALLRAMLNAGDVVPGFGGGGLSCTAEGSLIDHSGRGVAGLFAIGPARLGSLFESIAIPEIRQQARDLASLIADAPEAQGLAA